MTDFLIPDSIALKNVFSRELSFIFRLLSDILKQPTHWVEDVHSYSISDLVSVS